MIPRELLEPQEATAYGITIGDTATFDLALEEYLQQGTGSSLAEYLESGKRILRAVAPSLNAMLAAQGYTLTEKALVVGGMSRQGRRAY